MCLWEIRTTKVKHFSRGTRWREKKRQKSRYFFCPSSKPARFFHPRDFNWISRGEIMILGAFVRCYVFPSTSHSDPSAAQNDKECYIHLRRKFLQEMEEKKHNKRLKSYEFGDFSLFFIAWWIQSMLLLYWLHNLTKKKSLLWFIKKKSDSNERKNIELKTIGFKSSSGCFALVLSSLTGEVPQFLKHQQFYVSGRLRVRT